MSNKSTLILILAIIVIGVATSATTQIYLSQINQTNGEKFNESVIPDNFTTLKNFSKGANISLLNVTNPVVFSAYNLTPSANLPIGVSSKAIYEYVAIDTYSGFNLANGTYQVPISGWYSVRDMDMCYNATVAGWACSINLNINGVLQTLGSSNHAVNGASTVASGVDYKYLNASDVVWIENFDNSAGGYPRLYASSSKSMHVFKLIKIA